MTDTLSDVLRAVRLNGAIFFRIDGSAPWVAETPPSREISGHIMPGNEHVIEYHLVIAGSCWGGLVDQPPVRLETGDVIVFPQGDAHVISSAPGMRGGPGPDQYQPSRKGIPVSVSIRGGGNDRATIMCGFLGCDARPFNPLLAALPRVIHVRSNGERGSMLHRLHELAVLEADTPKPGTDCVLSRLSELLFIEVVRHYTDALPAENEGWFAGLRDPHVGRALQSLHDRPAHAWSLDELAKEAGVSRSILAERFMRFVGVPPIQYLAQWRIQLAASLLRRDSASLAEIAQRVGYSSEAALSKAFKRWVGSSPAHYRKSKLASS